MAAREARWPRQKGQGRTDFVFYIMMRREIQVSVGVGWLPLNIHASNAISSGNKSVQESNLTIVFKFNSEGNFGIGGIKGIVKRSDSVFLNDHETVINLTFPDLWWD